MTTAVANGDLSKKSQWTLRRDLELKNNHQHHGGSIEPLASEVTRVAREVGTEGKLGGQARVRGRRYWKDLTDMETSWRPTLPVRCVTSPK